MTTLKAITLWQPWASLCVLPRNPRFEERHRVEGGAVSCGYCNHIFTFNFMRDEGPHRCDCHRATEARAAAQRPVKGIETRGWPAPRSLVGTRIAIHAAATKRPLMDLLKAEALGDPTARQILEAVRSTFGEPIDLPLGAVVGTGVLSGCVQMADSLPGAVSVNEGLRILVVGDDSLTIWRCAPDGLGHVWRGAGDVTDQAPFGHFAPGRWAWMLTDVERFDQPIPAKGKQGIWEWTP